MKRRSLLAGFFAVSSIPVLARNGDANPVGIEPFVFQDGIFRRRDEVAEWADIEKAVISNLVMDSSGRVGIDADKFIITGAS